MGLPFVRRKQTSSARRGWVLLGVAAGIAALLAASSAARELFRGVLLGYRSNLAWVSDRSVSSVQISSTPRLTADLYTVRSPRRPLVIFAHGSVAAGRRDGTTRMISRRLQESGFPVLAVDLPGFGDSQTPSLPLAAGHFFADALVKSAEYAKATSLVGPEGFFYAGSSLGAMVALQAGSREPRPLGVVAIGAGDTAARYRRGGEDWKRRFASERLAAMRIRPDEASVKALGDHLVELDVVRQLEEARLPPVLLIYGERDSSLPSVRSFLAGRETAHRLQVIPDTPHSLYMKPLWEGLVLHNRETIDSILAAIRGWAERPAPGANRKASPPPEPARSARGDAACRRNRCNGRSAKPWSPGRSGCMDSAA